jgi:hypothetical protein
VQFGNKISTPWLHLYWPFSSETASKMPPLIDSELFKWCKTLNIIVVTWIQLSTLRVSPSFFHTSYNAEPSLSWISWSGWPDALPWNYPMLPFSDLLLRLEFLALTGECPMLCLRDVFKPSNNLFARKNRGYRPWLHMRAVRKQKLLERAKASQRSVCSEEAEDDFFR